MIVLASIQKEILKKKTNIIKIKYIIKKKKDYLPFYISSHFTT